MVHLVFECPTCHAEMILLRGMGNGHYRICNSCKHTVTIDHCNYLRIMLENEYIDKDKVMRIPSCDSKKAFEEYSINKTKYEYGEGIKYPDYPHTKKPYMVQATVNVNYWIDEEGKNKWIEVEQTVSKCSECYYFSTQACEGGNNLNMCRYSHGIYRGNVSIMKGYLNPDDGIHCDCLFLKTNV